ncbi:MAG TPA: hypothetical protein VK501_10515 [Baekduia sp.]|uniref:hypothetical protein n=1 Tax=Baekduia sp. TaxID=2600305 RepID=UPI002C87AAD7|nr:hypothetical protein [Baekduia sp.]HMJ34342.1 hypothetical protein [Baekduia sp.]
MRQSLVVQPLDVALVEAQVFVQADAPPDGSRWAAAHREWEHGWVRLTPHLDDDELEERYKAVGTILLELMDREHDDDLKIGPMRKVAMRAIGNARIALAAWLRGDELPPRSFPTPKETIELLGQGDPTPLATGSPLRRWLDEHPQPAWRSQRRAPRWRRLMPSRAR